MASNEQQYSSEKLQYNREVLAKQQALIARDEWHACTNCTHLRFSGASALCGIYGIAQPVPVLVVGCERWESKVSF